MDLKDIKRIIELMKSNELTEFEMEDEGFRISMKRGDKENAIMVSAPQAPVMMPSMPTMAAPTPIAAAPAAPPVEEDSGLAEIKSPIVGTFYRSSSPDADPYVSVGTEVDEDTVVCIVEAMKVMNEIKAETRGVIKKILVDNATPVEFGQPLFKVEPL